MQTGRAALGQAGESGGGVTHREEGYDSEWFEILLEMQARHFWYAGRHRFLLRTVRERIAQNFGDSRRALSGIDLGGGCGGWVRYLNEGAPGLFGELALADSSARALAMAEGVVGPKVARQQIDLRQLPWGDQGRWDVAFLLDVLEHIPEDAAVLEQVRGALKPGGLAFVTTPALRFFWSYNDEIVHHVKRYARADYRQLAERAGLELLDARYFMFFLSPLLLASRLIGGRRKVAERSPAEAKAVLRRTHKVPWGPINGILRGVFSLETPVGLRVRFPWGSSILGVFRRRS
jgi:SAM-dependent methyltransferase